MNQPGFRYVYGPVPSRRLGLSLGVDLVPFKTCTCDCIYCQLGRTTEKTTARRAYVPLEEVMVELEQKLAAGPVPDYITLSGSGEPTLHEGIGEFIEKTKELTCLPLAVLTNGSLLWQREVQDALMGADLVLPSLDAGDEFLFRYVNRPHRDLTFDRLVDGIAQFTARFPKPVWLEVFLLTGITGLRSEVEKIAALARRIRPERVHLHTVSCPPSEEFATAVLPDQLRSFTDLFEGQAEVVSDRKPDKLPAPVTQVATDADILALLSRRPCTVQGVSTGLSLQIADAAKRLQALAQEGSVTTILNRRTIFYGMARMKVKRLAANRYQPQGSQGPN